MVSSSPRPTRREVLEEGGLFHATSLPALRRILRDGHLRPALETGVPARGPGVASLRRRLSGVCLFDVRSKEEVVRSRLPNAGLAWLAAWLTIAKPVTVVIHLDKARVQAHGPALLSCAEARALGTGVMLPGELCHRGAIPLGTCVRGFLFVRRAGRTNLAGEYIAGSSMTNANIYGALAWLRRAQPGRT